MRFDKATLAIVAAGALATAGCSDERHATATAPDVAAKPPAEQNYAAADSKQMPAEPDNTGRNVRDRNDATLTPTDQSNDPADVALTQRIRQGITSNEAMSTQARNVKVIAQSGTVTLRGPVSSEQEKESIEAVARNAGAASIDNQLEIDRNDASGTKE